MLVATLTVGLGVDGSQEQQRELISTMWMNLNLSVKTTDSYQAPKGMSNAEYCWV